MSDRNFWEYIFPKYVRIGFGIDSTPSGLDRNIKAMRLPISADGDLIALPVVQFERGEYLMSARMEQLLTAFAGTAPAGTFNLVTPTNLQRVKIIRGFFNTPGASIGALTDTWRLIRGVNVMLECYCYYPAVAVGGSYSWAFDFGEGLTLDPGEPLNCSHLAAAAAWRCNVTYSLLEY